MQAHSRKKIKPLIFVLKNQDVTTSLLEALSRGLSYALEKKKRRHSLTLLLPPAPTDCSARVRGEDYYSGKRQRERELHLIIFASRIGEAFGRGDAFISLAEAEKIGVFFLENLVLDRGMCPSPVLIAVVCRVTFVAWCFFCFVGVLRCVLHFAIASPVWVLFVSWKVTSSSILHRFFAGCFF